MKKILCILAVICCHLQMAHAATVNISDIVMNLDDSTVQVTGAGAEITVSFVGMLNTYNSTQAARLVKSLQARINQVVSGMQVMSIDVCSDPALISRFAGTIRLLVKPISDDEDRELIFRTFLSTATIQQIAPRTVSCDRNAIFPMDTLRITVKNARSGMLYSLHRDYPAEVVQTVVGQGSDLVFSGAFGQGGYYVTDVSGQEMKNRIWVYLYWPLAYRVYPGSTMIPWVDKDGGIYQLILKMTNGPGFEDIQEMCRRYNDGEQNWNNRAMRLIPERQEYAEPGSWFYVRVAVGPNTGAVPVFNESGIKVANASFSGNAWEGRIGQNPGGVLKEWDMNSSTVANNSINLLRTQPLVNYELYNNGKLIDSKMQDDGGLIGFTDLAPGIYKVKAVYGDAELVDFQNREYGFDLDRFIEQEPLITYAESTLELDKNGGQKTLLCVRDERIPYEAISKAVDRFNATAPNGKMELFNSIGAMCRILLTWGPNLGENCTISSGFIFNGSSKLKFDQPAGGRVIAYDITDSMNPGGSNGTIVLSGSQYGVEYELWKDDQKQRAIDGTGEPMRFEWLDINALYKIRAVDPKSGTSVWMNGSAVFASDNQIDFTYGTNVISTRTYLEANKSFTDITYYNGLGYPYQMIQLHAGTRKRNVVTPILYDEMQRDNAKVLLPFVVDRYTGDRVESPVADQTAYYAQLPAGMADDAAYSTNVFDRSGLSRIVRSYVPGELYRDLEKFTEFRYQTNSSRDVYAFTYDYPSASISVAGNVPAGTLCKNTVIDADGRKMVTFTNSDGNVILERRNTDYGNVDTYYVYDFYFKRLCWVISPEGSAQLSTGKTILWTSELADAFCYRYRYDSRGNVIERQLPGSGKESFVYDKGGRMVLSCDGNLTSKGQWLYFVYDNHNNLIRQNLIACSLSRSEFQTAYEQRDNLLSAGADGIYANVPLKDACTHVELLLSNAYGNKEWVVKAALGGFNDLGDGAGRGLVFREEELERPTEMDFAVHPEFTARPLPNPTDLKTYEKIRILDGTSDANYVERYYFYDYKKRTIQISEKGIDGGLSRVYRAYDNQNNLLRSLEVCQVRAGEQADSLKTLCEYDNRGRLIRTTTTLNTSVPAVAEFAFDDFGRPILQKNDSCKLQTEQSYNLQGWLTGKMVRDVEDNELFGMQLHYTDPQMPQSTPSYTGNISEWESRNGADADRNVYAFGYDNLARLTGAQHYVDGVLCDRNTEKGLTYDRNGNLQTLLRTENGASKDSFNYSYAGNKLASLWDGKNSFAFSYDANGNMVRDGRKNVDLGYNCLNLLEKALRDSGTLAEYTYLADGTELLAQNESAGGVLYRGPFVYRKQGDAVQLESAGFAGGRIRACETDMGVRFLPQYFVTDHLGSVRAVYDSDSGRTLERSDYYPLGRRLSGGELSQNRYHFNGKEDQSFVDLAYLNYGARMYDPELGRWTTSDPQAEKYYPISSYAFCAGNTVRYIDPNGMEIWIHYQDDDGNNQKMTYQADMVYDGTNDFVARSVNYLNNIYAYGGAKAMDVLIDSSNAFNVTSELGPIEGVVAFKENQKGGGTLKLGAVMAPGFEKSQGLESMAHELFHGVQHELGQSGTSIFNEVEAYVFGAKVTENWTYAPNSDYMGAPSSMAGNGRANSYGAIYEKAFDALKNQFSINAFSAAVNNFKNGAYKNAQGDYNKYPQRRSNQTNYILPKFYPR